MKAANGPEKRPRAGRIRRAVLRGLWIALAAAVLLPYIVPHEKPGHLFMNEAGPLRRVPADSVAVLTDETAFDGYRNRRVIRQEIFDRMLEIIRGAESFVYLDFFLFNDFQGAVAEHHRALFRELGEALIRRKEERPQLQALFFTDPINRIYGRMEPPLYRRMMESGIHIVFTDLDAIPDPNRIYSPAARFYAPLLFRIPGLRRILTRPALANPLQAAGGKISPHQIFRLLHFKANHRKVLIADRGGDAVLFVTSFNPADGSSAHDNIAVETGGLPARDALRCEIAAVRASAHRPDQRLTHDYPALRALLDQLEHHALTPMREPPEDPDAPRCQWLTDRAIRDTLIEMLDSAQRGDLVRIGIFYLSDRPVIRALERAVRRGVIVRMVLDANKDAFGRVKNGIPNRITAHRFQRLSDRHAVTVRWADTHGEQYHSKFIAVTDAEGGGTRLLAGSANWTRRNIGGWNLEADLYLENAPAATGPFIESFDRRWFNADGLQHTASYERYAEPLWKRLWKTPLCRFQEAGGLSTF